jgi:hypothetical protein
MKSLIVAAIFAAYSVSAIAETKVIDVKLTTPVSVGATKTIEATFESLDSNAPAEFKRAVFIGEANYEKLSNGDTRLNISWNAVKDGTKSANVEPFITRASTDGASIAAGTSLKARGDTALLTAAIRNLQGKEATGSSGWVSAASGSGTTSGATASSVTNAYPSAQSSTSATTRSAYSSTPASSGNLIYSTPSSGSSGSSGSGSSSASSTTCKPIVDLEANTYTLRVKESDQCVDGDSSSIYETAQGCPQITDYNRSIVSISTRKYALPSGNETRVVPCAQTGQTAALVKTYEGCEQRHDFLSHYTFEQERYYFLWQEERNYVTDCRDSEIKYEHYLTTATCEPQNATAKLIAHKRIAYNQSNGTVGYATACQPVSDEIKIEKEFCEYEHDFVVNQSYRQERDYYIDPVSLNRVYLTNCSRTNLNFPHREESDGWIHDDENLRSLLRVRKYFIDTTINDKIYPNGVDYYESEQTVPYANKGTFTRVKQDLGAINDGTIALSGGVYKWSDNVLNVSLAPPVTSGFVYSGKSGGLYCAAHTNNSDSGSSMTTYTVGSSCAALDKGFGVFCANEDGGDLLGFGGAYCFINKGYAHIAQMKREIDYLRPDGSTYSVEQDTWYQVQP